MATSEWSFERYQRDELVLEFRSGGGAAIVSGTSPQEAIGFLVIPRSLDEATIDGHRIRPLDLVVVPPAHQLIETVSGPHQSISVYLPVSKFPFMDQWVQDNRQNAAGLKRVLVLRSRTLAGKVAADAVEARRIIQSGSGSDDGGAFQDLERSVVGTLSTAAIAALERARRVADASRGRRAESCDLARRAIGLIRSSPASQKSVRDLCAALDVSERQVRRSFNKIFGMGPNKFARLHRLNRVRRILAEENSDSTPIMDVLSAFDVTEFGRFAGQYKALFGETPSETRRRKITLKAADSVTSELRL